MLLIAFVVVFIIFADIFGWLPQVIDVAIRRAAIYL
jgi:hypothetical protein